MMRSLFVVLLGCELVFLVLLPDLKHVKAIKVN